MVGCWKYWNIKRFRGPVLSSIEQTAPAPAHALSLYCFKLSQVWAPYCRLVSSVLLSVSAEACLLAPLRLRWCRGHSSLSLHAPHTAATAASSCARCRAPRGHPTAVRLEDGRGYRVHYSRNLKFCLNITWPFSFSVSGIGFKLPIKVILWLEMEFFSNCSI